MAPYIKGLFCKTKRPLNAHFPFPELELVQNAAFTDPTDQSAWFYQRWLLGRARPRQAITRALLSPTLSFVSLAQPARSPRARFLVDGEPLAGSWSAADGEANCCVWVGSPATGILAAGRP